MLALKHGNLLDLNRRAGGGRGEVASCVIPREFDYNFQLFHCFIKRQGG
jgi:hypothetical protein